MLQWVSLAAPVLSCPIKAIRSCIFKPYIKESEEAQDTASLAFSIVKHATDKEGLHKLGRVWYQAILWKAYLPMCMNSFGFLGATFFDYYLNPWSDLRFALDTVLSHVLPCRR